MKFTINGFSQKKLIEFGLDSIDSLILRYFIDFKDSGEMATEVINGKVYYWISYENLLKQIPIIGIKNRDVLRRRLKKLEDSNILKYYLKKENGNYSFYAVGEKYCELISEYPTQKSEGSDLKVGRVPTQKSEQKINLLNNNIYIVVLDYLNEKAGTNYKPASKKTQAVINARLNEGFKEDDFLKVIDIKVSEWIGTEYQKYLRPETLFGTKFESYLNQKPSKPSGSNVKESTYKNLKKF